MLSKINTAALSAMIGLGALAAVPAAAHADTVRFGFDGRDGVRIEVRDGDRRGDWRDRREWRRHEYAPKCSPWRAENKARDMGLRRAHVVDVDSNRIVVRGHKWGDRQTVIFGRSANCPVRAVY